MRNKFLSIFIFYFLVFLNPDVRSGHVSGKYLLMILIELTNLCKCNHACASENAPLQKTLYENETYFENGFAGIQK